MSGFSEFVDGLVQDRQDDRQAARMGSSRYERVNLTPMMGLGVVMPHVVACLRCASLIVDTDEWRAVHDGWHTSLQATGEN